MVLSVADSVLGDVPSDWLVSTVGQVFKEFNGRVQTGPFGSQLHASDYVEFGVPTVMPANIGDNRIIENGISRIRSEDVERLKRHKLQAGDIVFSRRGDVERRSLVRDHEVGWLCGTGCLLVRPPSGHVDAAFLSYWFGHPVIRTWLTQHAIGATMLNLNTEILSSVPLVLPPFKEQLAIAGVLGALDDKIESNRRLVEISLDLVSTKFANEESLSAKRTPLSRLLTLERGREPGRDLCREDGLGTPFIRVSNLKMETHRGLTLENFDGPLAKPEDVLISFDGTPGRVAFGLTGYFSSGVRRALPVGRLMPTSLIWAMLSGESVQAVISEYATGTTIQHAGSALPHLTAPLLSESGFSWFENEGENLWRYILGLRRSSETLFSLQTSLSLELLSGRLRVKDAESMMENVR
jgi:hypothetical protein